jgi:spermidine synthase
VIFNDARFGFLPNVNLDTLGTVALFSIAPLCAALGYLTPKLIDDLANGNPVEAGKAYAINIAGSIVGPLLAGYLLLPLVGSKISLIGLALLFLIPALFLLKELPRKMAYLVAVLALASLVASFRAPSYEEGGLLVSDIKNVVLRRDYTATVISCSLGDEKDLIVNGQHMTSLAQVTKYMAHLPLALHKEPPQSALVICFGMGTTFRALLSWGINATAVELVPSVTKAFGYYHADAPEVLKNPKGKIVIDDGRRFLKRSPDSYDVITIDPPPPSYAAGSSLLYSSDFYAEMKQHLKPGGILQQWFPGNKPLVLSAVAKSLVESFRYVRAYPSFEDYGVHFFASDTPIENLNVDQLIERMPASARVDLGEWIAHGAAPERAIREQMQIITTRGVDARALIISGVNSKITDDRPFNEYFLLRNTLLNPHF